MRRAFCSGLTRAKIAVSGTLRESSSSSRRRHRSPVRVRVRRSPRSRQTFSATWRVVAGDDLDGDAELGRVGRWTAAASSLGWIDEDEVADEVEVVLVRRGQRVELGRAPGADGHDACTGGELGVEHPCGLRGSRRRTDRARIRARPS